MRLVLFLEYPGSYDCGSWTEVLPIEHEDKDVALLELWALIADKKKEIESNREAWQTWYSEQPERPKLYSGSNPRVLEKHAKQHNGYDEEYRQWQNKRPTTTAPDGNITFCGHKFSAQELDEEDVVILTIDEWFQRGY